MGVDVESVIGLRLHVVGVIVRLHQILLLLLSQERIPHLVVVVDGGEGGFFQSL